MRYQLVIEEHPGYVHNVRLFPDVASAARWLSFR
jgi:hypothetical protein